MNTIHDIKSLRESLDTVRFDKRIALVPTMGALHDGHLTLIREAKRFNDVVVVSIFVNPTQFGPDEDLDRYPRTLESDAERCRDAGVDIIFAPSAAEMYPGKHYLSISIADLDHHLCGASRPGHFNGVLQVVNKLFQIVQPHSAYFGQKDIQQFVLIQTMVREFNIPVELVAVSTVREPDGLALSSRNRYLSEDSRRVAAELSRAIQGVGQVLTRGLGDAVGVGLEFNQTSERYISVMQTIRGEIESQKERLTAIGFKIDYLEVVDFISLQPVVSIHEHDQYIVAIAAWLGSTRLIDNIIVKSPDRNDN